MSPIIGKLCALLECYSYVTSLSLLFVLKVSSMSLDWWGSQRQRTETQDRLSAENQLILERQTEDSEREGKNISFITNWNMQHVKTKIYFIREKLSLIVQKIKTKYLVNVNTHSVSSIKQNCLFQLPDMFSIPIYSSLISMKCNEFMNFHFL